VIGSIIEAKICTKMLKNLKYYEQTFPQLATALSKILQLTEGKLRRRSTNTAKRKQKEKKERERKKLKDLRHSFSSAHFRAKML